MTNLSLNARAGSRLETADLDALRITRTAVDGARVLDFGVEAAGGLAAGVLLADVCTAGLAETSIVPRPFAGREWPHVVVRTDHPVAACLLSQYAGWAITPEGWFGMGSGPMRAAAAVEDLFDRLDYREKTGEVVGVVEAGKLPTPEAVAFVAGKCGVEPTAVTLCAAPTASQAGNLQVVARSVETAMHQLFEQGFDVRRIRSGYGVAPLPPVAADDLTGIGRTNDAILYAATVHLWATGDDDDLADIVTRIPSCSSGSHGSSFLELFEAAGRDFYALDPHVFAPAEVVLHNLETGVVHAHGTVDEALTRRSFGV